MYLLGEVVGYVVAVAVIVGLARWLFTVGTGRRWRSRRRW